MKKNITLEHLPNLLILLVFSLILVIPPFLRGGREVLATFVLFVFLLPLVYLVWRLKGKFELPRVLSPPRTKRTKDVAPGSGLPVRGSPPGASDGRNTIMQRLQTLAPGASFIFLAIFILGMGVSVFYSPEKYQALETFLHFLAHFLLLFLIFNFISSKKQVSYFAYLVSALGFVLSVWGIYGFILSENFGYLRLISTFGWHIPFGEFLMYPLFLGLSLLFLKPSRVSSKIPWILLLSLFFIAFYFNHTRGAWLSFIAISFLLFLFLRKNILRKEVIVSITLIIILSLLGIYGLQQIKANQAAKLSQEARYVGAETIQENAVTVRLYFWQRALEIFKDRPFWGGGLESYSSLHKQYLQPPFYYSSDPHNFYLKVLAEGGIILFFVFLGFVASILYYVFQFLQRIKLRLESIIFQKESDFFLIGMAGGIGGALAHNFVNVGWFFPANLIIFFFFAGIILKMHTLEYRGNLEEESKQKNPILGLAKTSFIFLIAFILFLSGFLIFISDFYHEEGKKLLWEGEREGAIQNFQEAIRFNPMNPEYNRSLAGAYFLMARINEGGRAMFLEKAISQSKRTIGWTNNSQDFNFQGKIFAFNEEFNLAEKKFWEAISENPQDFDAYVELVSLYTNQNNPGKVHMVVENTVISQFQKEYILSPLYIAPDKNLILLKFSVLHNKNGEAHLKEMNFRKAETEFQKATVYYPQNEFAWKNLIFVKLSEGNTNAARDYLKEGLKQNPESKILLEMKPSLWPES